jgi:hypothetical protein
MNRHKSSGIALIVIGLAFLSFYFVNRRGAVWIGVGVVFIALGVGRLRRAP